MEEPYRTLLGHFRHEIGHYYFYRLIAPYPTIWSTSANCSATRTRITRRPSIAPTTSAHRRTGSRSSCRRTRPCTRRRTGPRRSLTCTSATPSTPPPPSDWRQRGGHAGTTRTGGQRFRQHHRNVAAVVVGTEHGQPIDGPR
jgi:hypothetical protein